jgi:phosphoribosylformylglycinamidine cyclo-ligase
MVADEALTYKAAGVDIDAGEALIERIREPVERTLRPEVVGGLGGFGAVVRVPAGYRSPVLVSGTDGVGTKLKLAIEFDRHDTVGIDLVAMCANDIVVLGAEPLFFLDYYVTPRLDVDTAARVIAGIARGCELAGCALVGGETAEHPGMHAPGEYDLAGFCVGVAEEDGLIDGRGIVSGDAVVGIASSGPHSNGFSLIRKVLERDPAAAGSTVGAGPLIDLLLEPTRVYTRAVLAAHRSVGIKGLAHITGGGLTENIPRVLPDELGVDIDRGAWPTLPVFEWLEAAGIAAKELYRTFNCGIGMIAIVSSADAARLVEVFTELGEKAWVIGEVCEPRAGTRVYVS